MRSGTSVSIRLSRRAVPWRPTTSARPRHSHLPPPPIDRRRPRRRRTDRRQSPRKRRAGMSRRRPPTRRMMRRAPWRRQKPRARAMPPGCRRRRARRHLRCLPPRSRCTSRFRGIRVEYADTLRDEAAELTDYGVQLLPSTTSSFLRPGSKFVGTQQSDRQVYDVQVEIKDVNMAESFLCGYLRIQGGLGHHSRWHRVLRS